MRSAEEKLGPAEGRLRPIAVIDERGPITQPSHEETTVIAELLEALGNAATSISAWPDREDGRWRWVYWCFSLLLVMTMIGFVVWIAR